MSEVHISTSPEDAQFSAFVEAIRHQLSYDAETGIVTRRTTTFGARGAIGTVVGSLSGNGTGYLYTKVNGRQISLHRLAWIYVHGTNPQVIDHVNGVTTDNRLSNLRSVTYRQNSQNIRHAKSNSSTGFLGVSVFRDKYQASIRTKTKRHYLGIFDTPEEAHKAYVEAKRRLHECNTL